MTDRMTAVVRESRFPILIWLLQLGLTTLIIFLFHHIVPSGPYRIPAWTKTFGGWDGGSYLQIAQDGYMAIQTSAFFPVYPLLIRAIHFFFHLTYLQSGLVISNLAYLVALVLLYRMCVRHYGIATSKRALWLVFCFPTAFFFNVVYTESLTFLLYILFFSLLSQQRWWAAMMTGFVATGVHDLNVLLTVPAFLYWWGQQRQRQHGHGHRLPQSKSWAQLAGIALIPLSLLMYMVYLDGHFHHPLAFLIAESHWGRHFTVPIFNAVERLLTLRYGATSGWSVNLVAMVNAGATLLFYAVTVILLIDRRRSWGIKWFFLGTLLASTSSSTYTGIESYARFVMVLFPAYPLLAKLCDKKAVFITVILLFFGLRVLLTGLFGDGYIVT